MSLKVNTQVTGGNAADIEILEDSICPEVRFASDPYEAPEALWFCFRLVETASDPARQTKVRLTWKHFDTMLGSSDSTACRPVFQPAGRAWSRLKQGEEKRMSDGRREVSWLIPHPAPITDVAFCFPYGEADVQSLLQRYPNYWQSAVIGVSQGGRRIARLNNAVGSQDGRQPGFYIVARQHAGETPGSWVLDGLLQHLAQIRKAGYIVWTVPCVDVDGIVRGHYGKDGFPYDLNRAWGQPPMRHETLVIRQDVLRWKARCHPILALDLHAPGACERDGVYAYVGGDADGPLAAEETKWCNVLQNELQPEFAAPEFKRVANYPSRWTTPGFATFLRSELGVPALSLETPYAMAGGSLLTQKSYREIGRRLAVGVLRRHG
ncbi:MAG: hypothetical protein L6300_03325 [Syntrophaceae bacterium]|nr:hypothetical protein [Syntrophaceae bacterium]